MAQMVKNLPAIQETWVRFLGQEDSLEKGMATHSNILAQRIPWTEEAGELQSTGSQRGLTEHAHTRETGDCRRNLTQKKCQEEVNPLGRTE